MADTTTIPQAENTGTPPPTFLQPQSRAVTLNKLYALPAPLRTFPLPTLVPHNPISLFHVLFVWLSQTVKPQTSYLETPYQGWWSPETRSVHVTDGRSIRGLWEQGFYGKGSLSRSEPSWLDREKTRRGSKSKVTSEELTRQRRAERQQTKWERARKEREAIDQKLLEEAEASIAKEIAENQDSTEKEVLLDSDTSVTISDGDRGPTTINARQFFAPVSPLELLSLPNSSSDLTHYSWGFNEHVDKNLAKHSGAIRSDVALVGPLDILTLPNSLKEFALGEIVPPNDPVDERAAYQITNRRTSRKTGAVSVPESETNCSANGLGVNDHSKTYVPYINGGSEVNDEANNGSAHSDDTAHTRNFTPNGSALSNGTPGTPKMKRQKSVRFSPTVEKNTFIQNEPPSPERAVTTTITTIDAEAEVEEEQLAIHNQEHFQLTLEEAFFLTYSLGALHVLDPLTKSPIPNDELFTIFRKASYFPPLAIPSLAPDDPFMLHYVVYHHFRSLGWVVRGGTKFSVDFMLYNRGPVFSHAEFAVIILPSYSGPYWSSNLFLQKYVKGKEKRTWAWMHCINRVISQVKKTLILTYVDIPKPLDDGEERRLGIDAVLGRYKVREVLMQRWLANRSRD